MNLWDQLKKYTSARIGLECIGHSISTHDLIDFQLAHAEAKDAVHQIWDYDKAHEKLQELGEKPLIAHTAVFERRAYLQNPDLGRHLNSESVKVLKKYAEKKATDIVFVITDGLSPKALDAHLLPFWKYFRNVLNTHFSTLKITVVLVPFGRVALGDEIGKILHARMSIVIVGERPGLTSADSLGIYLTYAPKPQNTDANRNCISNIHPPAGLDYAVATQKLIDLMQESLKLKISGFTLKEGNAHLECNDAPQLL